MKRIKAVIFDLDGTLANTLPLCIEAFRKSIEPLTGKSITDEEIIATFGPSEEGTIMALAPEHYEKGISGYLQHYETMHHMCSEAFDGIPELLSGLRSKNIRLAMVTGKGKHSTDISLKQFGLANYFEIIETGSPAGPRKADGIEQVLGIWPDLSKEEVIYVGDAPSDITACRQVGIPVIAAAWAETAEPEKLKALQPDELFYTVKEFAEWLFTE
jgi:HAD superfamily hydrolase (TIGR01549 family)